MLDRVRVGFTTETDLLSGENGIRDIPYMVPLLQASGAILILCDSETAALARSLVQSILLRAAAPFRPTAYQHHGPHAVAWPARGKPFRVC